MALETPLLHPLLLAAKDGLADSPFVPPFLAVKDGLGEVVGGSTLQAAPVAFPQTLVLVKGMCRRSTTPDMQQGIDPMSTGNSLPLAVGRSFYIKPNKNFKTTKTKQKRVCNYLFFDC